MLVKDIMSTNLCTVKEDAIISDVLELMKQNNYHRIPVVDNDNKLIGLLTKGTIDQNNASSSLSVFELNYLYNKLKAKDLMKKKAEVLTIGPDSLVEDAAILLRENKVGCLPVVDLDNKIVGIITHYDIFDSFIKILGYNQVGTRYAISIDEDKVGVINKISKCFADKEISISNIAVCKTEQGIEVVVIASGEYSDQCLLELENAGYKVTSMKKLG